MPRAPEKQGVVLRVARRARQPLRAEEIVRRARALDPGVGRATIYRALRALLRRGELERFPTGYGPPDRRSDHHHFVCAQCGRSAVPSLAGAERALQEAIGRAGFRLLAHDLRVEVRCAEHRP